jgi:hypothetical protein
MNTITATYNPTTFEKRTFAILIGLCLLFLGLYVFFVNQTVWNVAERQAMVNQMRTYSANMAALETEYMTQSAALTMERAYALGFKEASYSKTVFVKKSLPAVAFR